MFQERKRRGRKKIILWTTLIVILLIALTGGAYFIISNGVPKVVLKVKEASIFQDEELPEIQAEARCENEEQKKKKLEKNYTIENFIDDLNAGRGYHLEYDIDSSIEGKYPVRIVLDKEWETKIHQKWRWKIEFQTGNATFEVKNKYGTWDGDKFKKIDGSYAASEFVPSKGNMYYMDENEKKVTGWQEIDNFHYFFEKKGEMSIGWKEIADAMYYFREDGKMSVGWQKIAQDTYYFDKEGKMLTGEQKIFQFTCVFGEDGKLLSKDTRIDPARPMLALTFDDGPSKYTDMLLQKLEECGARATFFMLGKNAARYPDSIRKMEEIGCELGNHSMTHTSLIKLGDEDVKGEIQSTEAAIAAAVGHGASMLRPPYGDYNDKVKSLAGMPIMMWSVDTLDWKKKDAEKITEYVLNTVSDGDVVLMHDIHSFSVESALELIPELIERGYQLVTVSELAEARGVEMEAGSRYSQFYK